MHVKGKSIIIPVKHIYKLYKINILPNKGDSRSIDKDAFMLNMHFSDDYSFLQFCTLHI